MPKQPTVCALTAVALGILCFQPLALLAASCDTLSSLNLPQTTVTLAETVPAGEFTLPGRPNGNGAAADAYKDLPAFCRVAATLAPTSDSDIKIEVWLPAANWNGKFQAVGNGGWAGVISYREMSEALRRGFATASTDTGHVGGSGKFALGHPEKLIDFGYRSEHEMTVKAKAIVAAYYGNSPKYSYWNGCSTGGRQGLREAQTFPADYDGIIAGAAANPRTHLGAASLWIASATLKDPASYIPKEKYAVIHKAVLEACDALDGVKDGLLENPARCHFDPKVLECKGEDGPACLTAPQVEAARKIYTPAAFRNGKEVFPAMAPGSELGWSVLAGGPEPFTPIVDHFKYVVYKDPNWDWKTFDVDRDTARADEVDDNTINAVNPDLKAFFGHNGKLLMYHGWSDPNVAPLASVNYYESVVKFMGAASKTGDSIRLFMVPGMAHCGGGEGPNHFDAVSAIEQWVEKGNAPQTMLASRIENGATSRTRPLCPYPQVAVYKGTGSTDDARNFVCKEVSK